MATGRIGKKLLKFTGFLLGILLLLLTAFHFWFVAHAKDLLEDLVESKSHGRLKMKVKKFKFSYFSKKMEIEKAVFYNTDTTTSATTYRFQVDKINLQVYALSPIIFKQQFLIDSLTLMQPDITITKMRAPARNDTGSGKDLSIPEEMGKVYHSIQEALEVLRVHRFEIENARFTLINRMRPEEKPIVLTNLFFHIDNVNVDSAQLTGKENFLFGENLVLRTRNQDILFPDGRHRLNFSRFRINMRKKLVEFDSCTIVATKGDSSAASFKVFFDALLLTNIDFDTLYRHEVIKADSVYCVNPQFTLDVELGRNDRKKKPPKLDQIIQQLTGNIQLGFVIVNNASFNITTVRNDRPSTFRSDHNNFEMQGFSIDKDAPRPLLVKSFAMAIRNYENFLGDSSYSMEFDSILFNDNRIFLSNFKLHQLNEGRVTNSFRVPQFELRGLVWDDLVFNRHLSASGATLYRPLIDFTVTDSRRKKERQTIFNSLGRIGRVMQLNDLDIVDGQIDLILRDKTELHLNNAFVSIQSDTLFGSRRVSSMKQSVRHLNFSHGLIKTRNFSLELENARYVGDSSNLVADKITLSTVKKNISALARNVSIREIVLDDSSNRIDVNGLRWETAELKMNIPAQKGSASSPVITLQNIKGGKTQVNATIGERSISTNLKNISLTKLRVAPGKKWEASNPFLEGNSLKITDSISMLTIDSYLVGNQQPSNFQKIRYDRNNQQDSIHISVDRLSGIPDIEAIMDGSVKARDVAVWQPAAHVKFSKKIKGTQNKEIIIPRVEINKISIHDPDINYSGAARRGEVKLIWDGSTPTNNNYLELDNLRTGNAASASLSADKLRFKLNHFTYSSATGKIFDTGEGDISAELNSVKVNHEKDHPWSWSGLITTLLAQNFQADSLGKNMGKFSLNTAELAGLSVESATLKNPVEWLAGSPSFQLRNFTGSYQSTRNSFAWYNAHYAERAKTFSLDSFSYRPTLDHDELVASHHYQIDDFRAKTGRIVIEQVDPVAYVKDSILNIHTIKIQDAFLTDFRDLRPPFRSGVIKPMPVQMIRKIPFNISVDSILINNATTHYSELNAKSNEIGTVPVTRMTVKFFPVRNYNLTETDSLRIQANGYLMDSIWIRLRIRESYLDSLAGFLMTVRMKPADLTVLNPVLMPLSSVKLLSGYLDTLSLRAAGKDYLAYGEMKMFYRSLKVKFLKNGNETKKSFLTSLITFVANSFVIRNKNTSRTGRVFFIRLRDRSAMNYLVKTTMSGVASSIGARGNHKILRKYKKEIRQRNLPPIDYD